MNDNYPPLNPLCASRSSSVTTIPSRRVGKTAAKLGGYGGMAVAAWLVTAVATGYGLSAPDTTGTSTESSSTTSSGSTSGSTSTTGSTTSSTTTTGDASTSTSTG